MTELNSLNTNLPLLVRVVEARRLLANMSHRKFWELAAAGEFEITGPPKHRRVIVRSLIDYISRLERAPYSRKPSELTAA